MNPADRDGLTFEQAMVLRAMIGRLIRRRCICETLKGSTCFRCREVDQVKKAFPQNWAYAADLNATMGPIQ